METKEFEKELVKIRDLIKENEFEIYYSLCCASVANAADLQSIYKDKYSYENILVSLGYLWAKRIIMIKESEPYKYIAIRPDYALERLKLDTNKE